MKPQIEKFFRVAPLLAAAALLTACGSSVQPRDGASQTGIAPNVGGTTITQSGDVGTQCNGFDSSETRLAGQVTSTYVNGQVQEDKIRLRITSLNSTFDTGSNYHIKFFRWQVSPAGLVNIDSTPVEFIIEKGATNSTAISNRMSSLSANDIASLRSSSGVTGTTSIDFLTNTTLVLQNVDYNWQALKIVMYDGTTVIGSADLLLPVFAANPNKYASTHNGVLPALHPMFKDRAQNLSDADWGARFQTYCF
ncbi:MAG: hypothetical protein AAB250_15790 [Bdellovibrionota bacterium]